MTTLLITHDACVAHETPLGHPERADRLRALDQLFTSDIFDDLKRAKAPLANIEDVVRAHTSEYVEMIQNATPAAGEDVCLDPDTHMMSASLEAALRAVGSGILAVDQVMKEEVRNAFCAVRPPGHHAEKDKAMGFCLFNNIAIAAHYAREKHGLSRVAVVDFDVHHGNGTQDIFWDEPDMFYGSIHEGGIFPGTGYVDETGVAGNIVNAPLSHGADGEAFKSAMMDVILPKLDAFAPEFLFISAGFDAHRDDPLAGLNFEERDFAWGTLELMDLAQKHCNGRVVSMLEGGYNLGALSRSVGVHVQVLMKG